MTEGRETDAVAERPVELAYRPTVGEWASALRARARSTGAGRFQRRALVWTVAVSTVGALLSAAGSGHRDTRWPLYVGAVAFVAFMTAAPWLQARRLHRLAERHGDIRGTVDDTGLRLATAHSSASHDWHLYSRYVETPELFVLLSADKSAVGFVVLPKRAVADPEEVDRLRAVLDRRLVRADATEAPASPRSRGRAVGRGAGSVGLLLFFFAFAAVQQAAHPDRFPGIQNNTAPISAVMLGLGGACGRRGLVARTADDGHADRDRRARRPRPAGRWRRPVPRWADAPLLGLGPDRPRARGRLRLLRLLSAPRSPSGPDHLSAARRSRAISRAVRTPVTSRNRSSQGHWLPCGWCLGQRPQHPDGTCHPHNRHVNRHASLRPVRSRSGSGVGVDALRTGESEQDTLDRVQPLSDRQLARRTDHVGDGLDLRVQVPQPRVGGGRLIRHTHHPDSKVTHPGSGAA
ncbi:hypothetical protein T261_1600 [Streptomyces lydicus]|nr:hypothetical protein T261_1600 [Streptomyces lydicus]